MFLADPGETSVLFHEIGQRLLRFWCPGFRQHVDKVLADTLGRKHRKQGATADPSDQDSKAEVLGGWQIQVPKELEELTCNVVGVLTKACFRKCTHPWYARDTK